MPDIIAETARLVLRTVGEDDDEAHDRLLNSAAVMEHLGGVMERHEIEARHEKAMAMHARHGFSFLFAIEKASGEIVGYLGIKRVENSHAPNTGDHEVGWKIREDRWRCGYAAEAMEAVLEWAFVRLGLPHVVALTSHANVGSWKLMEKLGMVRRADLDFHDPAYADGANPTIQYALTRQQWENRQ